MKTALTQFLKNENGNIAVLSGLLITVIMGFTALGVDIGKVFTDRRKSQSATDLAALAAANDLTLALRAASATAQKNGFPSGVSVEVGYYSADPALAASDRFKPSTLANANAARVVLQSKTQLAFARALMMKDDFDISTTAIAARSSAASFAIGSRLLKLDNGLLNQLLGGLLGANVNLSVMDYQALVDTKIDLFKFLSVLGDRINVKAGTYDSILQSNVKAADVVAAMAETQKQQTGASNLSVKALSGIQQSLSGSSGKVLMRSLVDVGPYSTMPIGEKPKLGIAVAAMDFLTATGQLANGENQINVGLNVNIPGIAKSTLRLAVGERPKGTSWVTVGSEGASVHTAQTRLVLDTTLIGTGAAALVRVPIYIELASATAKLNSVSCVYNNPSANSVTLSVTPSVIDAWIGDVSNSQFSNFKSAPNPPAAALIDTSAAKVTGRAHITVSNLSAIPATFYAGDIARQVKKTVGTKDFTASLLSRLVADTDINVSLFGVGIGLPDALQSTVATVLRNGVSPLDSLLSGVLNSLGVGLGQADVWVLGQRCDGAVLVN